MLMNEENPLDLVSLLYEWSKEEAEKHQRELGTFWVVDLVRCPLKRDFERKYPELSSSLIFRPNLLLGRLVHLGLEKLLSERVEDVRVEVEGEREVYVETGKVKVRGRIDIIIGEIGIEIKTARADFSMPQQHHVDQLRAYNWLFDLSGGILIYVTPDRIAQYEVMETMEEGEIKERILSDKAPRYDWECVYCIYNVLCPQKRG